ncbi:MAG TPA: cell division protein SepF [Beutenbergiaceae bacterium]|nr:cell division protein SepF [Beutenbergiaceae bacterium]
MAGTLRKSMLWLGLSEPEHEEHEDYVDYGDEDPVEEVQEAEVTPISRAASHRDSSSLRRITTVHPRTYNDAKTIGEAFRGGTPVIMNLTDMTDAEAKRLVDFSAGLVFGLRGAIERVTNKVFLLSPATVEIANEEREPDTTQARFFNQS